ncbi:hypothetical protein [Dyadobacter sandarakinus]|uniref:Alkyl hydroperoxide reductase subunit C/ Thiol specific antioxidant domain-containing protein n=1 Tax=Dyadobacter sandarakinus TaxID=2747268 RepID=A0ABX7I9D4_9BACT|nr:hypothetical protein [Dyadobacter sandarakinus]QRR02505.1 hypothetical protein HWI92_17110 [Dyadobacter sandarakinus]
MINRAQFLLLLGSLLLSENALPHAPAKFRVIFFLDPECPVTNAYMAEIKKITGDYAGKDIAFEAIFPMQTIKDADISAFLKKYNAGISGRKDPGLQQSKRYKATVMPEVVVLNAAGLPVYQGAIDNWYYALGKSRPKATEHYLRNALDAALAGDPVLVSKTEAFGCLINL